MTPSSDSAEWHNAVALGYSLNMLRSAVQGALGMLNEV